MRNSWLVLLVFIFSCSDFEEQHGHQHDDLDELTIESIVTNLPVINIVVDELDFEEMYDRPTEEIEVDCRFNLYRNKLIILNDIESEVEIKGGRTATFELKSLGVKFEDSQDNSERMIINPPNLLPFHNLDKIKSLRLRNSGNDYSYTFMKDVVYSQMAIQANLDLELMYHEPCHVFVNGDYYALLNMRTESNAHGVSRLYEVKKSHVTMGKIVPPGVIEYNTGDIEKINDLVKFIEDENIESLNEVIDISNFIDYIFYETFVAHGDWPQNNVRFYAIDEGKFRFVLYDLDFACSFELDKDPIEFILNGKGSMVKDLFIVLYNDSTFKTAYDDRFKSLIQSGFFDLEHFENIVMNTIDQLDEDVIYHIEQFQKPKTIIEWLRNVDEMTSFYERRLNYVESIIIEN